jgi:hypothetical protein
VFTLTLYWIAGDCNVPPLKTSPADCSKQFIWCANYGAGRMLPAGEFHCNRYLGGYTQKQRGRGALVVFEVLRAGERILTRKGLITVLWSALPARVRTRAAIAKLIGRFLVAPARPGFTGRKMLISVKNERIRPAAEEDCIMSGENTRWQVCAD